MRAIVTIIILSTKQVNSINISKTLLAEDYISLCPFLIFLRKTIKKVQTVHIICFTV